MGGSSQTGSHRLRLSECLLQLGFALALELERVDWGHGGLEGSVICVIWKRSFEKTVMEVCVLSAELSQECGHHLIPLCQEPRGLDNPLGSTLLTRGRSEFLFIFHLNATFDLGVSCLHS